MTHGKEIEQFRPLVTMTELESPDDVVRQGARQKLTDAFLNYSRQNALDLLETTGDQASITGLWEVIAYHTDMIFNHIPAIDDMEERRAKSEENNRVWNEKESALRRTLLDQGATEPAVDTYIMNVSTYNGYRMAPDKYLPTVAKNKSLGGIPMVKK